MWYLQFMIKFVLTLDTKNKYHWGLYYMVQWFCHISFRQCDKWTSYFGQWVWHSIWSPNKYKSLWPLFHDSIILSYIFKIFGYTSMIIWYNESVCPTFAPQKINVGQWDLHFTVQWFLLIWLRCFLCCKSAGAYIWPQINTGHYAFEP